MKSFLKSALSVLFSLYFIFASCGCNNNTESNVSTAPTTSESTETTASSSVATEDEASSKPNLNYSKLIRSSEEIEENFNEILVNDKYRGTVYFKLGNDFEYIGSNGFADTDTRKKNSLSTSYYIGPITKQFTAAAIMLLQESGKLSTDDTLDRFYSDYEYGDKITLKNLLTMTAGIPDYMSKNSDTYLNTGYREDELPYDISKNNSAEKNHASILKWILSQKPECEAGEKFAYSNSAYFLLGDIIEKVSGTSYEDFVSKNILKPLNMANTSFEPTDSLAKGYQDIYDNEWTLYPGVAYSAAGLISNTNDMLIWVDALTGNLLLSQESREEMLTPYKSNFAYGVFVNQNGDYYIDGSIYRFNSALCFGQDKSSILVVFSNYTQSPYSKIAPDFRKAIEPYVI